jgi:division protein 1
MSSTGIAPIATRTGLFVKVDLKKQITGSADNTVRVWDLTQRQCISTLLHSTDDTTKLDTPFSTASRLDFSSIPGIGALQGHHHAVATGGADGLVRFWDTRAPATPTSVLTIDRGCRRTLAGHTLPVTALQFDQHHLISGSLDRSIRVWDLRQGSMVEGFMSSSVNGVYGLGFNQDQLIVAPGESDLMVRS